MNPTLVPRRELNQIVLAIAALALLSGCATGLSVTYDSDPQGAVLYQDETKYGYMPYTLNYDVTERDLQRGYLDVAGVTVRWASGAIARLPKWRAKIDENDLSQTIHVRRPDNMAGRDIDARFALELEQTRALERQARAQEKQAEVQRHRAAADEEKLMVVPRK